MIKNTEELIYRLYNLDAPNKELDREIHEWRGFCTHRVTQFYFVEDGNSSDSGFECVNCGEDTYGKRTIPKYTDSIDTALKLIPIYCQFTLFQTYYVNGVLIAKYGAEIQNPLTSVGKHTIKGYSDVNMAIPICIVGLKSAEIFHAIETI